MNSLPRSKVLLIHNLSAKFVEIDRLLLSEIGAVTELVFKQKLFNPLRIFNAVKQSDILFIWFASWYALWPLVCAKILRKKSIVVTGGYETVKMPEMNYGFLRGGIKEWVVRLNLWLADEIFCNSQFSLGESVNNLPFIKNKTRAVYLGLDSQEYFSTAEKQPFVVTVGAVNEEDLERKGLRLFVEAARHLPQVQFVLIGKWCDRSVEALRQIAPPNLVFTGFISENELIDYLGRAKVYVQASRHETFGLALAEAMLCGCVPVVSRQGALEEVVGDSGFYCDQRDPAALAEVIKAALKSPVNQGLNARKRIETKFPLSARQNIFCETIHHLMKETQNVRTVGNG